jgi:hypothetical protein
MVNSLSVSSLVSNVNVVASALIGRWFETNDDALWEMIRETGIVFFFISENLRADDKNRDRILELIKEEI